MQFYIIGNGESRRGIDLTALRAPTLGCNALYRDFTPSLLVSVDNKMNIEIEKAKYSAPRAYRDVKLLAQQKRQKKKAPASITVTPWHPYFPSGAALTNLGWCSGTTAAWIACEHITDTTILTMVGFDMNDTSGKVNNIYKGTNCYQHPKAVDYSPWVEQWKRLFDMYPAIRFNFIGNYNISDVFGRAYKNADVTPLEQFKREL